MIRTGEKEAWDLLQSLDSKEVTGRTAAVFDPDSSTYKLACLNQEICVSPNNHVIASYSTPGEFLINDLGEYSRLSILRYLVHAKDVALSGRLIKPADLPGGDFFLKGSHVLPLHKIIGRFEQDISGFLETCETLGGVRLEYGDAAIKFLPFPRVPVVIILWAGDDEFPSQASLLFDSSCSSHMAIDVLWSTAMMSVGMIRS